MRKVSGQDSVFDELFYDGDDVIFNLIYRIREDEKSQIYTDDRLYICAQSSPDLPVWLYMKGIPSGSERETLFALLVKIFAHNADVHINMQEPYASEILPVLAKKIDGNVTFRTYTDMNVYACYTLNKVQEHGSMIRVEKHYIPQIKRLIGQMSMDAEHIELSDTEAQAYAERNAECPTLYLWRDKDEIASMARIAQKAIDLAKEEGIKLGLLRPITLWPFPVKPLAAAADKVKGFISVELNMGQMIEDVRLATGCKRPVSLCNRTGGMIPSPDQVLESIRNAQKGVY